MRKTKMLLLGVLLAGTGAVCSASAADLQKYELDGVTSDFQQFRVGDTVPPLYMTPEYTIKQWQQRHLPAPDANTHWTYMAAATCWSPSLKAKLSKFTTARFSTSTDCA